MPNKAIITYNTRLKELFFDRRGVMALVDNKVYKALFWFGGRVREKTRSYLGKPDIAGEIRFKKRTDKKTGRVNYESYKKKRRKPRPAPKPPVPRVADSSNVTLRNIQYRAQRSQQNNTWSSVQVFGLKFSGTNRDTNGKSAPEVQEFGGSVKLRARVVTKRTKSGRPRKDRKGKVQTEFIFNRNFSPKAFKIPKRPYLGPTFNKTLAEFNKRISQGRFS